MVCAKKAQLQQFMADWGQRMNQTYKEYIPGNLINFNGVQAPDGLVGNVTMQPAIGQHPIYLEWSENGQVKDGYALVAVYSDAETQPEMQKHLYLFTIVNNQPLVLVTMQNQGDPYGYLYFGATDNAELRAGFEKIVGARQLLKNKSQIFQSIRGLQKRKRLIFTKECIKTRQTKFQLKLTGITISGQIGAR